MPRSHEEVNLEGEWACTLKGENFVIAAEGQEDKIILLGTNTNLHRLAESDVYYMDGTFQTCASLFYQIFSIHIIKFEQTFPMVYALLPNKQRHT